MGEDCKAKATTFIIFTYKMHCHRCSHLCSVKAALVSEDADRKPLSLSK